MAQIELDQEEGEIAQLAVQALTAAHRSAVDSGRSVLVLEKGELVRIGSLGRTVLKKLPTRQKVSIRIKRASS